MKKLVLFLLLSAAIPLSQSYAGEPEKLISGGGIQYSTPVWSPDGSKIAFTSVDYSGIWVMDLSDRSVRRVTDETAAGYGMKWSADSKTILARVSKYENNRKLSAVKLFETESGSAALLTDYRTMMPALPEWTNANENVVLLNKGQLEVLKTGKKASALLKQSSSSSFVVIKDDKIGVGNLFTGKIDLIDPVKGEKCINAGISPDGKKVVFEVLGGNLFVVNLDGTGLTDLGKGFRARWSPDSKKLIYMISEDDGHAYISSDIYEINADGTAKRNITQSANKLEMNPAYSPDGKAAAFDILDEGSIYTITLE